MLIDLNGKVALVTGAGRGIGRQIAETLAAEGVSVVCLDVNQADLDDFQGFLDTNSYPGLARRVDITDLAAVEQLVAEVVDRFGRIDILVNNAGVDRGGPIDQFDPAGWQLLFDVNVKGTFHTCRAVAPVMKRQRSGRIINAASFAAIAPAAGSVGYAASKAAVVQFSRGLAGELGPWNITVNSYAPGMIPTDMNGFANRPAAEQERLLNTLSLRRWGTKEEVANLICFLASDQAGYITGTLIDVSGGKLATQLPQVPYEWAAAQ